MANKVVRREYHAHHLNWYKDDTERTRRRNALCSKNGSLEDTGKALLALSKRSSGETARKAKSDATYFFAKHKHKLQLQGKLVSKPKRRN
jgi:hypothetical protein